MYVRFEMLPSGLHNVSISSLVSLQHDSLGWPEFTSEDLRVIGELGFVNGGLYSVHLPSLIAAIGWGAFLYCPAATVTIPSGNAHFAVHNRALYDKKMSKLVYLPRLNTRTELVTPDATTIIDDAACAVQQNPERIELRKVVAIGQGGFAESPSVVDIVLPSTVTELGSGAFAEMRSLYTINLPSSLTTISSRCFQRCEAMPFLELPDSIVRCESEFVAACTSLVEIWFGNHVAFVESS
jgi:hypothetical protein